MMWRDDAGQALVIVALATTVMFGVAALAVDHGLALAQRRGLVASADSAAMAAARYLLRFVVLQNGRIVINAYQEDVVCEATRFANADRAFLDPAQTTTVRVEFGNGTTWTSAPATSCPPSGGTLVPADTVYVRVGLDAPGQRVLGVRGMTTNAIGGAATVRLSGSGWDNGPVVPFIREYDRAFFDCGAACVPGSQIPMTIWASNDQDVTQRNFKGMLDLSRHSTRARGQPYEQLIASWDRSGSPAAGTPAKPDWSGRCPAGGWDTQGGEDPTHENKHCSGVNFARYSFGGRLSLLTDHSRAPVQMRPSQLPAGRAVCVDPMKPPVTPSCGAGNGYLGDWVETALGGVGSRATEALAANVAANGLVTPLSGTRVASGPNAGRLHGKAIVLALYLWDCAERFNNGRWQLILSAAGDCSTLFGQNDPAPDRVHLFTVVPYTVYEGLIGNNAIQGYFGGLMGNPTACRDCPLDPYVNSAYLVNPP